MNNETSEAKLALASARRAVKITIFVGMACVILCMINISIWTTMISATAQMDKKINKIEEKLESKN